MSLPKKLPIYTVPKFMCKNCGQVFLGTKPQTHTYTFLDYEHPKKTLICHLKGQPIFVRTYDKVPVKCGGEIIEMGYNEALNEWIHDTAKAAADSAENSKEAKRRKENEAFVKIVSKLCQANPTDAVIMFYNLYCQGALGKKAHLKEIYLLRVRSFHGVTLFDINGGEPTVDEEEEFVNQIAKDILSRKTPITLSPTEKEEQKRTITQSRRGPRIFYLDNQLCVMKTRTSRTPVPISELEKKTEKPTLPSPSKKIEEFSIVLTGDGHPEKIRPNEE